MGRGDMRIFKKLLVSFFYGMVFLVFLGFFAYAADLRIAQHSTRRDINRFLSNAELTLRELVFDFNKTPYARNISISKDLDPLSDGAYIAYITFDHTEFDKINSITINNIIYTSFSKVPHDKYLVISIRLEDLFMADETSKKIKLNSYEINTVTYTSSITITAFREINYDVVEAKKQSVVGIQTRVTNKFGSRSIAWGSGVIYKKVPIKVIQLGIQTTYYEYYIITNAHVVEGGNDFIVHYQSQTNTYPKHPNDTIVLVGTYTVNTDIAVLKLTTKQSNLVALNDKQFETKVPVEITEGQVVFAIGSPVNTEGGYDFNNVKEGTILHTKSTVYLKDDNELCNTGCVAIQTSAFQGNGSSGGGVFNTVGELVGIHFAANLDNETASEIPMARVLEALEHIFNPIITYEETYNSVSFFIFVEKKTLLSEMSFSSIFYMIYII